jgi:chromosome partitioning protein
MPTSNSFNNPDDFELHIRTLYQKMGYRVIRPESLNNKGYDLELITGNERIAVQIKNHRTRCNIGFIRQFQDYLELPIAERFTSGWFISASGYSKPALTHVESEKPSNIKLITYSGGRFMDNYPLEVTEDPEKKNGTKKKLDPDPDPDPDPIDPTVKYIGVFTSKGGVGKTTVAAHLAGAFALMGYDVILLDLDPEKNLRKLFLQDLSDPNGDASLYVPSTSTSRPGAVITVLNHDQWNESEYKNVKVIICDCSPTMSENPRKLVEKFDYCIIPTTLNPLGIAKNGSVITRTFEHIRSINEKAEMYTLVNCYETAPDLANRNTLLATMLSNSIKPYTDKDPKCKFIPTDKAAIRRSAQLQYWGYHIINGSVPQLAFNDVGGRCYPRTDFLVLADYLVNGAEIQLTK